MTMRKKICHWEVGPFAPCAETGLNKQMDRLVHTYIHALTHKHTGGIIHAVGCP